MKTQTSVWALLACAGLVAGQARGQVKQIVVRPSPVHAVPEDPAAIDANPVLNPGGASAPVASPDAIPADAAFTEAAAVAAPTAKVKVAKTRAAPIKVAALTLPKPRPVAAEPALAPPPPVPAEPVAAGPKAAVARTIVDAAGAFDGYMRRAAAIKADFGDGEAVSRAVTLGSVYEPGQLERGAIAYAALLALQDPRFVQVVHDLGEDPAARDAFVAELTARPEAVLDAPAARRAAGRVSAVLGRMGLDLVAAGAAVKQAAYDVQKQDWSRRSIAGPDKRLETLRAQSSRPVTLAPADTAHLIADLAVLKTAEVSARGGEAVGPVVTRGLAVAALAVLGRAGEDDAAGIAPLLTEAEDSRCIKMAQLNLMQCLAVVGPQYENAFCLGRHAMMETGRCVASAAGLTEAELKPAGDTRSVMVPMALAAAAATRPTTAAGPEEEAALGEGPASAPTAAAAAAEPKPAVASTDVAVPLAVAAVPVAYSPYAGPTEH